MPGENKIWTLQLSIKNQRPDKPTETVIKTKLEHLLIIFETKAWLQILQNVQALKSIAAKATISSARPQYMTSQSTYRAKHSERNTYRNYEPQQS